MTSSKNCIQFNRRESINKISDKLTKNIKNALKKKEEYVAQNTTYEKRMEEAKKTKKPASDYLHEQYEEPMKP